MMEMIPKAYIMNSLKVVSQAHNNGEVPKDSQENHDARNCSIILRVFLDDFHYRNLE